jgi:hypothetical protein
MTSEPGWPMRSRDKPGGRPVYWPGGVGHRGGASLFCGFCMERGKAGSDNGACWLSLTAMGGGRREGERPATEIAGRGVPMRDSLADRLVVVVMLHSRAMANIRGKTSRGSSTRTTLSRTSSPQGPSSSGQPASSIPGSHSHGSSRTVSSRTVSSRMGSRGRPSISRPRLSLRRGSSSQ